MTLQDKRKEAGYTQKELSDITGISLRSIQHLERNYRLPDLARLETLCKLSIALKCPIDDFLTDENVKNLYRKSKVL